MILLFRLLRLLRLPILGQTVHFLPEFRPLQVVGLFAGLEAHMLRVKAEPDLAETAILDVFTLD